MDGCCFARGCQCQNSRCLRKRIVRPAHATLLLHALDKSPLFRGAASNVKIQPHFPALTPHLRESRTSPRSIDLRGRRLGSRLFTVLEVPAMHEVQFSWDFITPNPLSRNYVLY
jgi:hypothetical protein